MRCSRCRTLRRQKPHEQLTRTRNRYGCFCVGWHSHHQPASLRCHAPGQAITGICAQARCQRSLAHGCKRFVWPAGASLQSGRGRHGSQRITPSPCPKQPAAPSADFCAGHRFAASPNPRFDCPGRAALRLAGGPLATRCPGSQRFCAAKRPAGDAQKPGIAQGVLCDTQNAAPRPRFGRLQRLDYRLAPRAIHGPCAT